MTDADWLDGVEPHQTGRGSRLDLRLYVYPDGHGNIYVSGSEDQSNRPVNDLDEAIRIFEDLWKKATISRNSDGSAGETKLAAMLQKVTPDNLHTEVNTGAPLGQDVW